MFKMYLWTTFLTYRLEKHVPVDYIFDIHIYILKYIVLVLRSRFRLRRKSLRWFTSLTGLRPGLTPLVAVSAFWWCRVLFLLCCRWRLLGLFWHRLCPFGVFCVFAGCNHAFYTPYRALTRLYSAFYSVVVSLVGLTCFVAQIGCFSTLLLQHESEHLVHVYSASFVLPNCLDHIV